MLHKKRSNVLVLEWENEEDKGWCPRVAVERVARPDGGRDVEARETLLLLPLPRPPRMPLPRWAGRAEGCPRPERDAPRYEFGTVLDEADCAAISEAEAARVLASCFAICSRNASCDAPDQDGSPKSARRR